MEKILKDLGVTPGCTTYYWCDLGQVAWCSEFNLLISEIVKKYLSYKVIVTIHVYEFIHVLRTGLKCSLDGSYYYYHYY